MNPCVNSLHGVSDICIIQKKVGTDPPAVMRDLLDKYLQARRPRGCASAS